MSSKSHPLIDKHAPKNLVLKNQEGESVELNSYIGNQKPCIIFFYPQDETYGCTREVCSFRDSYDQFSEAGATVFGISSDTVEKHKNFAKKQNLQFSLLSDPNGEARRAFEVPKTLGLLPGRATFLIDKEGIIKDVYNSQLDFQGHANKSLEFIKSQ
ncbi:10645_t:CDS:2 [Entrophospora sp. SA101]|nr:10095_t:CDS:2 [Entrophospora sp. SA101]CAJ0637440.1 10645_t:CDS:2 [Entrophospora sp. SA101]CAJ0832694.1 10412_t:CDS:2 [Entrophospora sp. SA101]CAJ0910338.1 18030_t:CDS:2 [Entrophospora sp. SA101]